MTRATIVAQVCNTRPSDARHAPASIRTIVVMSASAAASTPPRNARSGTAATAVRSTPGFTITHASTAGT